MRNVPDLDLLAHELSHLKHAEDNARLARLRKELEILEHPEIADELPMEGTLTRGCISVRTGYTRKWDQDALAGLAERVDPSFWPFVPQWKEDRKAARVIEERFPELWADVREALTLNPSKPAVTLKARKKEAA